ncbi:MAG: nicotinamide riboside transporter PnuC [Gammaproteobacteria bacterium]|nr:nicotinamide riboside transporter PnuC [Gammaproteobacteria bacterium]
MGELAQSLRAQLTAWSPLEVAAVVFAVLYLLLAIRENIWCWLCAGVSTAIYVWLFAGAKLYMESLLNVFYFGMAIYGWHVWTSGRVNERELPVTVWPLAVHAVALLAIAILVATVGTWLSWYTDAAYPYVDSATTFGAIWATLLVARKVLENWWYWLAIDVVSTFIFWGRGLELTSLLFALYVAVIPFGLAAWKRSYRRVAAG